MIETAAIDARKQSGVYDVVLADVPCSGFGVIRKKPEIRFKDPTELEQLPPIQRAILEGLAPCVRPGGVLLYSTCTILPEENEEVVIVTIWSFIWKSVPSRRRGCAPSGRISTVRTGSILQS